MSAYQLSTAATAILGAVAGGPQTLADLAAAATITGDEARPIIAELMRTDRLAADGGRYREGPRASAP